jgi:4-hydroxy-3-polyprenylbenzoate decarboxylase
MKKQRLVIGISGSSGAILGIRLLEALRPTPIETHLVVSPSARLTIEQETDWAVSDVLALADQHYAPRDISAAIASGSFQTLGMVVIPCSMKSLSAIANSYADDLLSRAADVTLKEGRPLVLVVRETPLHAGHIRLMSLAAQNGAIIFPPVPAFYAHPESVADIVDNLVGRILQRLGIENDLYEPWQGLNATQNAKESSRTEVKKPQETTMTETWQQPAMTLATTGADGFPHAAAVYFASDEEQRRLYFFSDPNSQHGQDLTIRPQAAAAIYPPEEHWQAICGLQLRGEVHPAAPGEEWEEGWRHYLVKFPFVGEMKEILEKNALYVFQPNWGRWIDNRQEFGHKEEWTRE